MKNKVVITGIGSINPIGNNVEDSWDALSQGISGITLVSKFDVSGHKVKIAGEVKNFNATNFMPSKEVKKMDVFIHFALAATEQAMLDAGLEITEKLAPQAGVCIGVGIGGLPNIEKYRDICRDRGEGRITPFFIPMTIANMTSGQISLRYGTKGYNATTTSACSSANHSIGDAARIIERGDAQVMIAGGAEAAICPLALGGFGSMKALSIRNDEPTKASRPYDVGRDGFVLGEGAATLILESETFAKKRGAKIYAELSGYGFSSDAYHMTAPSFEGPSLAMKNSLKDAGVNPDEVDYINAHGTSTPLGDINEIKAIKDCFGLENAKKISISSSKSMTGHLLGGAGGIEAIFLLKAMEHGIIPPTINVDKLDPECDLDVTPNKAKERKINIAISNSFGFGGTNATLLFKRYGV